MPKIIFLFWLFPVLLKLHCFSLFPWYSKYIECFYKSPFHLYYLRLQILLMTLNLIKIWIWELKPWVNNPLKPQFSGCFAIVVLGGERGHHITTYLIYTVFEGVVLLLDNTLYWSSLFRLFTRIMHMKDSLRTKM